MFQAFFLTGAKRREWMGLGLLGFCYYWLWNGSFPHSRSEAPVSFGMMIPRICGTKAEAADPLALQPAAPWVPVRGQGSWIGCKIGKEFQDLFSGFLGFKLILGSFLSDLDFEDLRILRAFPLKFQALSVRVRRLGRMYWPDSFRGFHEVYVGGMACFSDVPQRPENSQGIILVA